MTSIARFLGKHLKLTVNWVKSAVDRPWRRKFLGYSMTFHTKSRLKVAAKSVQRLMSNLKELFRTGRGRNIGQFIQKDLNPVLRGWIHYFHLSAVKGIFDELDGVDTAPIAVRAVETVEAAVDTYGATDGKRLVKATSSSVSA